jgi:ABC-2 type transport system ATP-binding protein
MMGGVRVESAKITVQRLSKTYRVPERGEGLAASLKSLVRKTYVEVAAVRDVNFSIQPGEMVGFIGPNGAGKTTTLKMLAGLLHPTSGDAAVAGYTPWSRKPEFLRRISMVLGNKSQMIWDIPPLDSFRVVGEIYGISAGAYRQTLDELIEMLDMKELLTRPVRNLSLGERMKCELVAALLYRPEVLFLDEPTLGLDISMQSRIRRFISAYNQRHGATVLLTSHYMADVTALCPRVILIHHGGLLYDGKLSGLSERLSPFKLLRVTVDNGAADRLELPGSMEIQESVNGQLTLRVSRAEAPQATAYLLNHLPVTDLSVEDPPIEAVIDQIYQEGNL